MAADADKEFFLRRLMRRIRKTKSPGAENSISAGVVEARPEKFGLFQLTSESEDTLDPGLPDIIAVHGINGDAFNTWTHSDHGALWLRDFLPSQIPGARVFTFGYDSNVAFTRAKGCLDSYARELLEQLNAVRFGEQLRHRPLIFVAHSMGGIVVKQAMIIARLDAVDYSDLLECTKGILFLSTPHRGSSTTIWPLLLSNILNVALTMPKLPATYAGSFRNDLLNGLLKESQELQTISESFRNQIHNTKIVSFVEQNITPPFSERVVDNYTGVLGIPKETIVPMSGCDHHTICKFHMRSNSYRLVFTHLKALSADLPRPASLLDIGELPPLIHNQGDEAKSSIETRRHPIQTLGQDNHNSLSRSLDSRRSTLVKDAKYTNFFLSKGGRNFSYTNVKKMRVVIGLDYGTSYTSVAFAPADGKLRDIRLIQDWPGGSYGNGVPSQIKYGPFTWYEDPYIWGYLIPANVTRHTLIKRLLDADRIPRQLQLTSGWSQCELEEGRPPYPAKEPKIIIQDYLTAVKKSVFRSMESYFGEGMFNASVVDVVITVPALWSDRAKELAFQAAKGAHFERGGGEVTAITEPEAAATYIIQTSASESGPVNFKLGDHLIVCDAGGLTVDLISYKIRSLSPDLTMEEAVVGIGDKCGSTLIDQSFRKWMEEKLGREVVERIPAAMLMEGGFIARDFECSKRKFGGTPRDHYINIPPAARVDDDPKIGLEGGALILTHEDLRTMFDPCVNRILALIGEQVASVAENGGRVKFLFLVGGFGESRYLQEKVFQYCRDHGLEALVPDEASSAVAHGAVARGLEVHGKRLIEKRKCRYHYGTPISEDFDPRKHDEKDKYIDELTGNSYVAGQMKWLIAKGTDLYVDQVITATLAVSRKPNLTEESICFAQLCYCTNDKPPSSYMDDDVIPLCNVKADLRNLPETEFQINSLENADQEFDTADFAIELSVDNARLQFTVKLNGKECWSAEPHFDV